MRSDLVHLKKFTAPKEKKFNLATNENHFTDWSNFFKSNILNIAENMTLNYYGDSEHSSLKEIYGSINNLPTEMISVASGSESLIPLLFKSLTEKNILTLQWDFFRYDDHCKISDRTLYKVQNSSSATDIINFINSNEIELFIFSNPNNPTGEMKNIDFIETIVKNTRAYVLVDEAYVEYADFSSQELLGKYKNLLILRTLSKAYGLASLRVGFVLGTPELIDFIDKVKGPFTLSDLVSKLASSALQSENTVLEDIEKLKFERGILESALKQFPGFEVHKSHANFIFAEHLKAKEIQNFLAKTNIIVSCFGNALRITVGNNFQNLTLLEALDDFFKEEN